MPREVGIGTRFEPLLLRIGRLATLHLNSRDLQTGNRAKGIPAGLGPGEGDWWLEWWPGARPRRAVGDAANGPWVAGYRARKGAPRRAQLSMLI